MTESHRFLETLTLVLLVAAGATVVCQRLRQPVVLGYLLAGMIVGPNIPVPLLADSSVVRALSEFGVILLMFSLGIEFSFKRLVRVGGAAALVAVVECSAMIALGYLAGRVLGWSRLESVYAGAIVAISSTTIIVKAFAEQKLRQPFTELVLGVLVCEDLVAILLITMLTTLSAGETLSLGQFAAVAGRLALFLGGLIVGGIAIAPRLIRAVVALKRPETTVVAAVGLAFGFALVASECGYSVALGAFIAGGLVALSGVEHTVGRLVEPVRDIFAAIFFVSVGMLIDPAQIYEHWRAVALLTATVVVGKALAASSAAFLSGQRVESSVKAGMSLTQIGEFSFIIASVGVASGAVSHFLYPVAVAVSAITTLTTPWMIRAAGPVAKRIDRALPRSLQTFVALYGAWLEQLRRSGEPTRLRSLMRWLAADAILVAAATIGAATQFEFLSRLVGERLGLGQRGAGWTVIALWAIVSAPFWVGMIRSTRRLGFELAERVFPPAVQDRVDVADAARRLLIVTLQLSIAILVGAPLVAVTQPFLPWPQAAVIFALLLLLLGLVLWRRANNFQGHITAASQVIAEALARQTRDAAPPGDSRESSAIHPVQRLFSELGDPTSATVTSSSPAAGRTLAELDLRGLTGATVLAIRRDAETIRIPDGRQRILAGDTLVLAGSQDAIVAAKAALDRAGS